MTIKVTKGLEPEWFIPDSQKDESSPSEFKIEPMTSIEYLAFSSTGYGGLDDSGNIRMALGERELSLVLKKVKAWKNIEDESGEPMQFSPANLRSLPMSVIGEILQRIMHISTLSQVEEKN